MTKCIHVIFVHLCVLINDCKCLFALKWIWICLCEVFFFMFVLVVKPSEKKKKRIHTMDVVKNINANKLDWHEMRSISLIYPSFIYPSYNIESGQNDVLNPLNVYPVFFRFRNYVFFVFFLNGLNRHIMEIIDIIPIGKENQYIL